MGLQKHAPCQTSHHAFQACHRKPLKHHTSKTNRLMKALRPKDKLCAYVLNQALSCRSERWFELNVRPMGVASALTLALIKWCWHVGTQTTQTSLDEYLDRTLLHYIREAFLPLEYGVPCSNRQLGRIGAVAIKPHSSSFVNLCPRFPSVNPCSSRRSHANGAMQLFEGGRLSF